MPRADSAAAASIAPAPLLVRLRGLRPSLSPAEDRVAEQVLADARAAAALTISELAVAAHDLGDDGAALLPAAGAAGLPAAAAGPGRGVGAAAGQRRQDHATSAPTTPRQHHRQDVLRRRQRRRGDRAAARPRRPSPQAAAAIAGAKRVDIYGIGASAHRRARPPAEAAPHRPRRVRLERPAHRPDQRDAAGARGRRRRDLALRHHQGDDRGARGGARPRRHDHRDHELPALARWPRSPTWC